MKKQTNWITIPEEILHTPVSGAGQPQNLSKPVKNKWFWGIGFIVLVFAAFAALAPSQFSELLKGSLFDTTGSAEEGDGSGLFAAPGADSSPIGSPQDLLAPSSGQEEEEEPEPEEPEEEPEPEEPDDDIYETPPVVQPEEEAVSISIEPIVTGTVDCGSDADCLISNLKDCTPAKGKVSLMSLDESEFEIKGIEEDDCLVNLKITKLPMPGYAGKEAECKVPRGSDFENSLAEALKGNVDVKISFTGVDIPKDSVVYDVPDYCTGSLVDMLEQFLGEEEEESPAEDVVEDIMQTDLVGQLTKQIEQLQSQKDLQTKALEDLAKIVQDEMQSGVRQSAPVTTVPPSITTTTTIAQPSAMQPGFRLNPYRVTITPEEMMRQNQVAGTQYIAQPVVAQTYQAQVITTDTTPDTGPSDIILIAFIISLLSMLGWRFVRTVA